MELVLAGLHWTICLLYEGVSKNTWTFIITLKLLNVNR